MKRSDLLQMLHNQILDGTAQLSLLHLLYTRERSLAPTSKNHASNLKSALQRRGFTLTNKNISVRNQRVDMIELEVIKKFAASPHNNAYRSFFQKVVEFCEWDRTSDLEKTWDSLFSAWEYRNSTPPDRTTARKKSAACLEDVMVNTLNACVFTAGDRETKGVPAEEVYLCAADVARLVYQQCTTKKLQKRCFVSNFVQVHSQKIDTVRFRSPTTNQGCNYWPVSAIISYSKKMSESVDAVKTHTKRMTEIVNFSKLHALLVEALVPRLLKRLEEGGIFAGVHQSEIELESAHNLLKLCHPPENPTTQH